MLHFRKLLFNSLKRKKIYSMDNDLNFITKKEEWISKLQTIVCDNEESWIWIWQKLSIHYKTFHMRYNYCPQGQGDGKVGDKEKCWGKAFISLFLRREDNCIVTFWNIKESDFVPFCVLGKENVWIIQFTNSKCHFSSPHRNM